MNKRLSIEIPDFIHNQIKKKAKALSMTIKELVIVSVLKEERFLMIDQWNKEDGKSFSSKEDFLKDLYS